jgi:hypothetical protein
MKPICDWCGRAAEAGELCPACAATASIAVLYEPHVAREEAWAAWLRLLAQRARDNRPLFDDLSERPMPPARGDYTRCRKAFRPTARKPASPAAPAIDRQENL